MDKKYRIMAEDLQNVGTIDQTPLYVREIIKRALLIGSTSIVISHNHPSGDTQPSSSDIYLTKQLAEACKSVGIELIDHIIITFNSYLVLRKTGCCESFYSYNFTNVLKEGEMSQKLLDNLRRYHPFNDTEAIYLSSQSLQWINDKNLGYLVSHCLNFRTMCTSRLFKTSGFQAEARL